jgi:hypothetical protein
MILASNGIIASSIQSASALLLDTYPSAAAAYSVRKLRTAYTGSAIRVRRTDLTEQDIGFSGGNLDTAALLSFTGTGALDNGFITTWYDQSGNAQNATQTTAVSQPIIVSAGVLLTQNSKPTIKYDGTNDFLSGSAISNFVTASTFSNIAVFNPISLATNTADMENNDCVWMDGIGYVGEYFKSTSGGQLVGAIYTASQKLALVAITANTQNTSFITLVSNNISISKNNGAFVTSAAGAIANVTNGLTIAKNNVYAEMNCQELIWYKTDQTANVSGINGNVNSYYGIY